MKKKIIVLIGITVICLISYLYFPRKIISQVTDVSHLTVAYTKADYILKDGDYQGVVTQDKKTFERDSREYNEFLSILKNYTYHKGSTFDFNENAEESIAVNVVFDIGKPILSIDSHQGIAINGHRYEVGYFGHHSSDELCKDIIKLLK